MIRIFILLAVLSGTISISASADTSSELFLILTSSDAETQMMALVLTTQAMNQNVTVRVLLCSDAANLALRESDSPAFKPANRSPKDLIKQLLSKGAVVEVCGIFLPNRPNLSEKDLLDNVGTAHPPEVASYMKRPDVRYFSF